MRGTDNESRLWRERIFEYKNRMITKLKREDLVYPDLSYTIIGCSFEVFNEIGGGHKEAVYQKAMKISFDKKGIKYKEQVYIPLEFKDVVIGKNFFDFLVDDKVIVELKSLARFTKANYDQVLKYLNTSGLKLALLLNFGMEEVRCKRVINFNALKTHS